MVSFKSLPRAMKRVGVHPKTCKVIMEAYIGCTTTISCNKARTSPTDITRGVKQGDPLSPVLFNLVMDELLASVDHSLGIQIEETRVAAVAYANDLLIMGENILETQHSLDSVVNFLNDRNLPLNVGKCTPLSLGRVPNRKKLFIHTSSLFHIDGEAVPCINPDDQFKYLGRNFDFIGVEKIDVVSLIKTLDALSSWPLKPQQKFFF